MPSGSSGVVRGRQSRQSRQSRQESSGVVRGRQSRQGSSESSGVVTQNSTTIETITVYGHLRRMYRLVSLTTKWGPDPRGLQSMRFSGNL